MKNIHVLGIQSSKALFSNNIQNGTYDGKSATLLRSGTVATQPKFTIAAGLIWPIATVVMHRSSDRWHRRQRPVNLVAMGER
jgi:hypothetical protein